MRRTTPQPGTPVDINLFVELLDEARGALALDDDKDHYDRHHSERAVLDDTFDDLIDHLRAHQVPEELDPLTKPLTDPDLQPGDLISVGGKTTIVREIIFHKPRGHAGSGLPQHQAAFEIVTSRGSTYIPLIPGV
ncbi:hypothetical protein [Streptomyces goshikiensis]|uniref:hypothetical protein n=1 Tax=Streptomyces goshikiensis TaxID=1942 RepID=UPI00368B7E47